MANNLQLALLGNSTVAALVDGKAELNWLGLPQLDGDPVFNSAICLGLPWDDAF